MMYTKEEIAVALRRCADGICKGCPFDKPGVPRCDGSLMKAAAELLEEDGNG